MENITSESDPDRGVLDCNLSLALRASDKSGAMKMGHGANL
jgi:hypothetical protein